MSRIAAIALVLAIAFLPAVPFADRVVAAPAGHVTFLRSEPAPNSRLATPPTRVAAFFEKELDRASTMRLLRTDGSVVDTGPARLEEHGTVLILTTTQLTPGTYVAHWRGVDSHDGHTLDGWFAFAVGEDPAARLRGFALTATAGSATAALEISPGRLGENSYRLALSGASGGMRAERALLRFAPQVTPTIGYADAQLSPAEAAFTGRGMELALRGSWKVTALVRFSGQAQDTSFEFTLAAPAPETTPTPTPSPTSAPTRAATPVPTPTPLAVGSPATAPAPAGGPDPAPIAAAAAAAVVLAYLVWRRLGRRGT